VSRIPAENQIILLHSTLGYLALISSHAAAHESFHDLEGKQIAKSSHSETISYSLL